VIDSGELAQSGASFGIDRPAKWVRKQTNNAHTMCVWSFVYVHGALVNKFRILSLCRLSLHRRFSGSGVGNYDENNFINCPFQREREREREKENGVSYASLDAGIN
jgi:hypothetical protein